MKIFSINQDAKTIKGVKYGYLSGIQYLAPTWISGHNMCASSSAGCEKACLYSAGRGGFTTVQDSRIRKTKHFIEHKKEHMNFMRVDIGRLRRKAKREGLIPVARPNGTSDYPWEKTGVIEAEPDIQWYDYTKILKRAILFGQGKLPKNYHLTFSRSEDNWSDCVVALKNMCNVAVVFRDKLPKSYKGYEVINGDDSDLRFLDKFKSSKTGGIVGLKAKGPAKKDKSGFVVD